LLIDKDDPRVKEIMKKTQHNPRSRLTLIYDLCKSKTLCEGADEQQQQNPDDDEAGLEKEPTKVGGCGRYLPQYKRVRGIEIEAEWKKHLNEDTQERKKAMTAQAVLEIFKAISDEDCEILGILSYF
jgi:DNA-directed RNA polymerase II subunit RPB1